MATTIIAVPVDWTIYEVDSEVLVYLNSAIAALPPFLVLEALVLQGRAKRLSGDTVKDEQTMPWVPGSDNEDDEDDNGES